MRNVLPLGLVLSDLTPLNWRETVSNMQVVLGGLSGVFLRDLQAYIGSANLTNAAWFKNVECGVFFTEEEMAAQGIADELEDRFSILKVGPYLCRRRSSTS